jgi:uncharacterized protein
MSRRYFDIVFTPSVLAQQSRYHTRDQYEKFTSSTDTYERLGPKEVAFIAERDTIYVASWSETGWPYVQHRGGPKGFLHVLDPQTLAFADFRGNGQYVSLGNLTVNNRVSLLLMDYAHRRRLKILGSGSWVKATSDPALYTQVAHQGYQAKIERIFIISVEAFDWNCSQHITPRYTEEEIRPDIVALHARIAELEAQLASALSVRTSS